MNQPIDDQTILDAIGQGRIADANARTAYRIMKALEMIAGEKSESTPTSFRVDPAAFLSGPQGHPHPPGHKGRSDGNAKA